MGFILLHFACLKAALELAARATCFLEPQLLCRFSDLPLLSLRLLSCAGRLCRCAYSFVLVTLFAGGARVSAGSRIVSDQCSGKPL